MFHTVLVCYSCVEILWSKRFHRLGISAREFVIYIHISPLCQNNKSIPFTTLFSVTRNQLMLKHKYLWEISPKFCGVLRNDISHLKCDLSIFQWQKLNKNIKGHKVVLRGRRMPLSSELQEFYCQQRNWKPGVRIMFLNMFQPAQSTDAEKVMLITTSVIVICWGKSTGL